LRPHDHKTEGGRIVEAVEDFAGHQTTRKRRKPMNRKRELTFAKGFVVDNDGRKS
jgi:hypothetical protein